MIFNKIKAAFLAIAVFAVTAVLAFDAPDITTAGAQTQYWFETTPDGDPVNYIGNSSSGECPDTGSEPCERAYLQDQVEFDASGNPTGVEPNEVDQPVLQINRQ